MTVVAAARLKDRVIIGCDTQINFGGKKLFSTDYSKLVEIRPNLIIGFCGLNAIYHVLAKFKKRKNIKIPTNVDECYNLTRPIFEAYRKVVKESLMCELSKEELSTVDLLIATDSHIFTADELSCEEFGTSVAIGSGEEFALASLHSCYPAKNCVKKALLAACQYSDSCSQPIIIKELIKDAG